MILALLIVALAVTLVLSVLFIYWTLRSDDFDSVVVGVVLSTVVVSLFVWAFLGLLRHVA